MKNYLSEPDLPVIGIWLLEFVSLLNLLVWEIKCVHDKFMNLTDGQAPKPAAFLPKFSIPRDHGLAVHQKFLMVLEGVC